MKQIVLLCNAGLSTSILVKKMEEAAQKSGYACTIHAHPASQLRHLKAQADVVLLGPQIRYLLATVKESVPCPVDIIDMSAYGLMDGHKVLQQARKLMKDEQ